MRLPRSPRATRGQHYLLGTGQKPKSRVCQQISAKTRTFLLHHPAEVAKIDLIRGAGRRQRRFKGPGRPEMARSPQRLLGMDPFPGHVQGMRTLRALGKREIGVMPDRARPCGKGCVRQAAGWLVTAAGVATLAATISGCSAREVERRDRPPTFVNPDNSWEVVLRPPSPAITQGPETSRLNDDLNEVIPMAMLATNEWPTGPRPDLRYDERVHLPTRARTYLYFNSTRSYGYPYRHHHHSRYHGRYHFGY